MTNGTSEPFTPPWPADPGSAWAEACGRPTHRAFALSARGPLGRRGVDRRQDQGQGSLPPSALRGESRRTTSPSGSSGTVRTRQ